MNYLVTFYCAKIPFPLQLYTLSLYNWFIPFELSLNVCEFTLLADSNHVLLNCTRTGP